MVNPPPAVGKWYARPGGDSFEIVAFDSDDGTIEIQYFDGTIEELDLDEWREELIYAAEPPEDWTGSVDVEPEDYENEFDTEPNIGNGKTPLEYFRIDLVDVRVTAVMSHSEAAELMERVQIGFNKIRVTYTPQSITGAKGGGDVVFEGDAYAGS